MNTIFVQDFFIAGEKYEIVDEFSNEQFVAIVHSRRAIQKDSVVFPTLNNSLVPPSGCLTVSAWNPFNIIFGWNTEAKECNCLRSKDFANFVKRLHSQTFIECPWPISDALLVSRAALSQVLNQGNQIGLGEWLKFFPIGTSFISMADLDFECRDEFVNLNGPGVLRKWILNQKFNFTKGIIPVDLGISTRTEWVNDRKAILGTTYLANKRSEKVFLEITNLRGIIVQESYCCSKISRGKPTMFLTEIESLSKKTQETEHSTLLTVSV